MDGLGSTVLTHEFLSWPQKKGKVMELKYPKSKIDSFLLPIE
jgi:hypothetical protein